MLGRSAIFLTLILIASSVANAEYRDEWGDLRVYLGANIIVRTDPGAFDIPIYAETVTFYDSVQKLLEYSGAAPILHPRVAPAPACPPLPLSEEKFLHLEQQVSLRQPTPDLAGISWQITIDALKNLFEPVVWVDMEYAFVGTGS